MIGRSYWDLRHGILITDKKKRGSRKGCYELEDFI